MNRTPKPAPFVLVSTGHGSMISNIHDYRPPTPTQPWVVGVGAQLLANSLYDPGEIDLALQLLTLRQQTFGPGVVALDCGANIGVHTIEWARHMTGWGEVTAFEAQARVFYALCGNIALNNCFNANARHVAIGAKAGEIVVPILNYAAPSSFGSLELRKGDHNEDIGQPVNYGGGGRSIPLIAIDDLGCKRLDLIKMDIEGMEMEGLEGAVKALQTLRPMLMLEHTKAKPGSLQAFVENYGYSCFTLPDMIVAVHRDDKGLEMVARGLAKSVVAQTAP